MSSNESDHDTLVRNTVLTEQILRQLTDALGQLSRGNERFQRIEMEMSEIRRKISDHDTKFAKDIPEALAQIRGDMLRAIGSTVEESKKNVETSIAPLRKQMEPIVEVVDKTHALVKWALVSLGGGVVVALVTAYVLHLFSF